MMDFNLDQLQRDMFTAESYLKAGPQQRSARNSFQTLSFGAPTNNNEKDEIASVLSADSIDRGVQDANRLRHDQTYALYGTDNDDHFERDSLKEAQLRSSGDNAESKKKQEPSTFPLRRKVDKGEVSNLNSKHVSQPAVVSKAPKLSESHILRKVEELYHSNDKKQQALHKQKVEFEQIEMAECTFTPKLSKGTEQILRSKAVMENRSTSQDFSPYFDSKSPLETSDRLFNDAVRQKADREWARREIEKQRRAENTFQPTINPAILSREESDTYRPIYDRVVEIEREKKRYLQDLKEKIEREQLDLTFQPSIDGKSRRIAENKLRGIRYDATSRDRTVNASSTNISSALGSSYNSSSGGGGGSGPFSGMVFQKRSQESRSRSATTSPARPSSARVYPRAPPSLTGEMEAKLVLGFHSDVVSRLMDEGRLRIRRLQEKRAHYDNLYADLTEQTFVSKGSQRIAQKSPNIKQLPFEERQRMYEAKKEDRALERQGEVEAVASSWFNPAIHEHTNAIIARKRPELMEETVEQRALRLNEEARAIRDRQEQRADEYYQSITSFQPQINTLSRLLSKGTDPEELVENARGKQIRENIRRRQEEEFTATHTFQPQINELSRKLVDPSSYDQSGFDRRYSEEFKATGWADYGSGGVGGNAANATYSPHYGLGHRVNFREPEKMVREMHLYALEKEERRRSELIAREIEELKGCTFQPEIPKPPSAAAMHKGEAVEIKGLGRFLELKQMSAKQKEDARLREAEVFSVPNVDKYRRAEDGSTIVQGFHFSDGSRKGSKSS